MLQLSSPELNDPVKICRELSAIVNSSENNGIIEGNWSSGKYKDEEEKPILWFSSVEILQKYYKKCSPVKYGQCWVFAGLLTTSKYIFIML